ncbi:hypothetical protein HY642_03175 [Candidatus Woesearchaeota archaeon]|nr:hypothetical protein [Candidatus Woesearchaeota archaeon]
MADSAHEQQRLQQQQREHEREQALQLAEKQRKTKKIKRWGIAIGIFVLVAALIVRQVAAPGQFDSFAKCLTEKGAVMYGAIEWCTYTQQQQGMFGKSFKFVNYKDYRQLEGIKKTPTWVIDGKWYPGVQDFERLSELTGCALA